MSQQSEKKIVLIAPGDVENEADAIRAVIEQANHLLPDQRLNLWYWRTDGVPGAHLDGPQGLADEQMNIPGADLVIAIFWSRIGTPVLDDSSGTVHELKLAWKSWGERGKPTVWVYFCTRDVPQKVLKESGDQFAALVSLQKSMSAKQSYAEFGNAEDLQRIFTRHLGAWLKSNGSADGAGAADNRGLLAPPDASRTVYRMDQLKRIGTAFAEAPIVCLHGISGSGKTRLAAQYAHSSKRLKEHSRGILWYDMPDEGTVEDMFAVLPYELVGSNDLSLSARCKTLLTALELRQQLLVMDDFHQADRTSYAPLLKMASRQACPGPVLILSREALLLPDVAEVAVRSWNVSEAKRLLGRLGVSTLPDSLLSSLTDKTGGLPLAITFFAALVKKLGRDPAALLQGELTQTPLTESWYEEITAQLSLSELSLLRFFSLAEPYITEPVLRRAQARLVPEERSRSFFRLQRVLLVESRGHSRWAVHPFVAEHTLHRTDKEVIRSLLLNLSDFSRAGIRHVRSSDMDHKALAAGIRACRYALRAEDLKRSTSIIGHIAGPAKRLGYYSSLRDLCRWHLQLASDGDPWLNYHYAHCQLILGEPHSAIAILTGLGPGDVDSGLAFAAARILADARCEIGDRTTAKVELKRALGQKPTAAKGSLMSYAAAQATLARMLIESGQLNDAAVLVGELARGARDDRSLAVITVLLGQLDAHSSPQSAEMRFRLATNKFRSIGDRRGLTWALRGLAEALLDQQGDTTAKARRPAREAMSVSARIGVSTTEYCDWLKRMRPGFEDDISTSELIDNEISRVSGDLELARGD